MLKYRNRFIYCFDFLFVAGGDYTGGPYVVTFSAGQSEALVPVPTTDDSSVEGNEAFYVKVLSTCGPQVSVCPTSRRRIVIVDDDSEYNNSSEY